jgi:uncharacterized FAD-dependent dehydrogenase
LVLHQTIKVNSAVNANKQPPPNKYTAWRVYNVEVWLKDDPGKDNLALHSSLLNSLAKLLRLSKSDKAELDKLLSSGISLYEVDVVRKSFDGRWKKAGQPKFVYTLDVKFPSAQVVKSLRLKHTNGKLDCLGAPEVIGREKRVVAEQMSSAGGSIASLVRPADGGSMKKEKVVVVGAGPAGLFAAIELIKGGFDVVIVERGQPVEQRGRDIGALFNRKILNPNSNLCYGEGGAGTWSDGKLTTRIGKNSEDVRDVLKTLVVHGAPESILVAGKPHLGTDRLVRILRTLRANLVDSGAEFLFGHTAVDVLVENGHVAGVELESNSADEGSGKRNTAVSTIQASKVVFAVGHSARRLYERLLELDVAIETKPIAVGFRVEHPQDLINRIQYGEFGTLCEKGKGPVPVADYRLTAQVPDTSSGSNSEAKRGVYSFCMCPGGQIVPTSVNPEELCINGMSFSQRQSKWANSALVVTVNPNDMVSETGDWDNNYPLRGVLWQEHFERLASKMGGGDLVVPVQRVTDFMSGTVSEPDADTGKFSSSYRMGVKTAPLHELYPPFVTAAIRAALIDFDRRMPGFVSPEAILHGVETRTSAPVQITRNRATMECETMRGLYPAGEGAGYAGGIVSAAVDGLRVGRAVCGNINEKSGGMFDVY